MFETASFQQFHLVFLFKDFSHSNFLSIQMARLNWGRFPWAVYASCSVSACFGSGWATKLPGGDSSGYCSEKEAGNGFVSPYNRCHERVRASTLSETNSSHLKRWHPKRIVSQPSIFRGESISFREGDIWCVVRMENEMKSCYCIGGMGSVYDIFVVPRFAGFLLF